MLCPASTLAQLGLALWTDIRQLVPLPVDPELFHRVQFRGICRRVLRHDGFLREFEKLPYEAAVMGRQLVPDDQQRLVDVTQHRFDHGMEV